MRPQEIQDKIKLYDWRRWLERPFGAFILSLFKDGGTRPYMQRVGIEAECEAWLFQQGKWYLSDYLMNRFANEIKQYLNLGGSIYKITESCECFYKKSCEEIIALNTDTADLKMALRILADRLTFATTYIWLAHGLEIVYMEKLLEEVPKHIKVNVKANVEKFIGDISFPSKKNAHNYLEDALRRGDDLREVREKYGWIRARDGFSDRFTLEELTAQREALLSKPVAVRHSVQIPKQLETLARETQELVYFRTFRTDVFYELLWLCRPILIKAAKHIGVTFSELRNYSLFDIIAGVPREYPQDVSAADYRGEMAFFAEPIVKVSEEAVTQQEIKGTVAYAGTVRGTVKVVKHVSELDKVKDGDILVTQMTFPSFIMAMKRAAGFVTDEGGITCHAAIVAREMKKPCIIGTKNATRILHDGDVVEVDAVQGLVRKIN